MSSELFLCSVIMIMVYLNLHESSVMVRNLTSEGNGSKPGPSHFAIKRYYRHRITKVKVLEMEEPLLENNSYFEIIFSSKESAFGNLFILVMYWNRGITFSKRLLKIKKGMNI